MLDKLREAPKLSGANVIDKNAQEALEAHILCHKTQ